MGIYHLYDVCIKTERESLWILTITNSYDNAVIRAKSQLHANFVRMQVTAHRHDLLTVFEINQLQHLGDCLTMNSLYAEMHRTLCATSDIWFPKTRDTDHSDKDLPVSSSIDCWIVRCLEHSGKRSFTTSNVIGANYYMGSGQMSERQLLNDMIDKEKEFRYNPEEPDGTTNRSVNIELKRIELSVCNADFHVLYREII